MKKLYTIVCLGLLPLMGMAQHKTKVPGATTAEQRMKAEKQRKALADASVLSGVAFRSVGPTVMSGRVTDLAVDPNDPTHFYVAYASGGLWETKNNGISFAPLFDQEAVMTIGDIAVNWKENIIWVGTGENNSSRSSYSGIGIYKSSDNGATWTHSGLPDSHHIGRIVLHPTNKNTAWVAVLGHLYSPNNERGVYMTTDGGLVWKRTLEVDPNSGAIDLVVGDRKSNDPKILYASIWNRERRAWNFVEAGKGTGIYKSVDAGLSWKKISGAESGFPNGEGAGRIGLAVASDDGNMIYALIDNQFRKEKEKAEDTKGKLTKDELRTMKKSAFLDLEDKQIATYLKDNGFPEKYTVEKVKKMVKSDKIKPIALVEYLEDSNSLLFDTPVIGAELYLSKDGGKSWQKTHTESLDDVYYSYGYYFGMLRVDPSNNQKVYIAGVPILKSDDGGKTFESINEANVHADHHALWINPNRSGHLINGNDGGVNISYDDGTTWFKANMPAVGQFYTVQVDNAKPYNIYGGLQDNGVWKGPSYYKASSESDNSGHYPYESIMGGDGMQIMVDNRNNDIVYTGYQFGNYYRLNLATGDQMYIQTTHDLGERPLRFNWQTPIHLSVHNQDILYMGSNKFHRSMKQGEQMKTMSDDLTNGGKKGDVSYGTLTSIHESPLRFGLIYVGSDDGLIHVTKDGGNTWTKISESLPENMWVTRVQASAHEEGTVYATLNGYRWDHFQAYVYVSKDYGKTWGQLGLDLPGEPVNVVLEDPNNENVLYVGTDHGLYVSLDKGAHFMTIGTDLPAVAVHDLVIQPTAKELIVGTHGRSIYVTSIKELGKLDEEIMAKNLHAFKIRDVHYSSRWGNSWSKWMDVNTPEVNIPIWTKTADEKVTVTIKHADGLILNSFQAKAVKGLNYLGYALEISDAAIAPYEKLLNKENKEGDAETTVEKASNGSHYLLPGEYTVIVSSKGETSETVLKIKKR